MSPSPATPRLDPDELAGLEEQRDFLLRSLADLEREHDAGDLDDHDYATLRDDYTARAAEALRAIDQQRSALDAARRPSRRGRTLGLMAGVLAFAVVAGLLVADSLGARNAGDTITGGVTTKQSASQRAQSCIAKMNPTAPKTAIDCFTAVLDDDPRNPVALTWLAWQLDLSAGFVAGDQTAELRTSARQLIDRAIAVNPDYSYARAFRAVLAYRRGDYADAKRYLADFEANDPSTDAQQVITAEHLDTKIAEALAGQAKGSTTTAATSVPTGTGG